MMQIDKIHRIDIHTDERSIALNCISGTCEITQEKIPHFTSIGGLRAKDKEIITEVNGMISFTPVLNAEGLLSAHGVKAPKTVSSMSTIELLNEIIRRQEGGEIEEEEVLPIPINLMDQMEAAAEAGDRDLYMKLKEQLSMKKNMCIPTPHYSGGTADKPKPTLNPEDMPFAPFEKFAEAMRLLGKL